MKKQIRKRTEKEILKIFPLKAKTPGWFFRMKEMSNNAWEVEGTDQWGRLVYRQGSDAEELIAECEIEAERISEETKRVT
jgi:hypothetical protein